MVYFVSPRTKRSFATRALQALFRGASKRRQAATLTQTSWAMVEGLEDRVMLSGTTADDNDACGCNCASTPRSPQEDQAANPLADGEAGPYDYSETFQLHSKPDSNYTIYLDFDGHRVEGTGWNNANFPVMDARAYDTDGDPTTFSNAEQDFIQLVWQAVAEDFAGFDVNVTTEDPGVEALQKTGGGDTQWGVRALITYDDFGTSICGGGSGGCAYIGNFDGAVDQPAWVFNKGSVNVCAMTISHEVGHTLGLGHDGDSQRAYYGGHGSGNTSWGPIMGAPFGARVVQWSKGDYFDANLTTQDDLMTIVTENGFGYRQDDHGDTRNAGSEFNITNLIQVDAAGIIETNTDIDYFRFETGTGPVSFDIANFSGFPNLDIWAGIFNTAGELVAESNMADDLSASFTDVQLQSGVYYLRVEGVGSHDVYNPATDQLEPPANPPWLTATPEGYSDYSSLGFYTITGAIQAAQLDFGDAPDSYGTLEASDGARHINTGATLGTLRDFEPDGLPSVTATAEGADDDGVQFLSPLVAGKPANISISAPLGGVLDAWIDYNGNGTFDPEEQIFTDEVLVAGFNDFVIDVPADAELGQTYARFRIADDAAHVTGPTGKADTGEVEDYAVSISPFQSISEVFFNPDETDDTGKEYIELRGEPNSVIPQGTFFVAVDGAAAAGTVEFVYNVGGLSYGDNGYLVLLQRDSVYADQIDPASNVVMSTENGWADFRRKVNLLSSANTNLDDNSSTYFLVQTAVAPRVGDDIDADNDGTTDGSIAPRWTVLDAIGNITSPTGISYGNLIFSTNGGGLAPATSTVVNVGAAVVDYVGRIGTTDGNTTANWVGGELEAGSLSPNYVLGLTSPAPLANRPLDHIGAENFVQADYGDAPDSYGTSKGTNGASHGVGGPRLGTLKDVESSGSPGLSAGGDNLLNDADEDGVVIPTLIEGTAGNVSITLSNVTAGAVVQGWFDWNGNGIFETDEMAINQTVATNGTIQVPVTAPIPSFDNTFGSTYARIRVSTAGNLGPNGAAVDGEVEDYVVNILTSATDDFGDAPDSYGTTLANNGARHTGTGPYIGNLRDVERDGNPTLAADGDNKLLFADEDGISYPTPISPGHTSTIYVDANGTGYLDAWLDADLNGTFDADEQIITNRVVTTGRNTITFNTPADAVEGQSYIRYRITSTADGVTGPTGAAPDGEVQDDRVTILPIFNRPPTIGNAQFSLVENSPTDTVVGSVTGSEPDLGQTLRYAIVNGNLNQAFKINPVTGVISVNNAEAIDYEFKDEFELKVRVTDTGVPALSATATVIVTITDVFDPPSIGLRESSPNGTTVTSVPLPTLNHADVDLFEITGGNVGNAFNIDALGVIRVNNSAAVDYETTPVFNLEITATDNAGPTVEVVVLKIKLIDRNEAPMITDYEFTIGDNPNPGLAVGQVQAFDPDNEPNLTYSLYSGNDNGAFRLDPITGELTLVDPAALNFDAEGKIELGLLVLDNGEFLVSVDSVITIRQRPADAPNPADVMAYNASTNEWILGVNNSSQFAPTAVAWVAGNDWKFFQGDFNDDGQTDVAGFNNAGEWHVGLSTGVGLDISQWAQWNDPAESGWKDFQVGDFNGDGKTDIAARTKGGYWYIARSQGDIFGTAFGGRWAPSGWDNFVVGDFNGDGKDDIAGDRSASGDWWINRGTTAGFQTQHLGRWSSSINWADVLVGDFNGDNRDDIAGRNSATGQWWLALAAGNTLSLTRAARWTTAVEWTEVVAGDFNGDGRDDILGRQSSGQWYLNRSIGTRMIVEYYGGWSGTTNWTTLVGDFNDDGKADVAGLDQATGTWQVSYGDGDTYVKPNGATANKLLNTLFGGNSIWGTIEAETLGLSQLD